MNNLVTKLLLIRVRGILIVNQNLCLPKTPLEFHENSYENLKQLKD